MISLVSGQGGVEHDLAGGDRTRAMAPISSPSKALPSASTSWPSRIATASSLHIIPVIA